MQAVRRVSAKNVHARAFSAKAVLPDLNYDYNELEPIVSAKIMELHHGKHHATYVNNYNSLTEQYAEAQAKNDVQKMIALQQGIRFNGGGHINHSIFWTNLAPPKNGGGGEPTGALKAAIEKEFGSFDAFKTTFSNQTAAVQGSGWGWLGYNPTQKRVQFAALPNQDPLSTVGLIPLLGVDVWEHAYYLDYKNVRPDYLKAIWEIVNWKNVEERFAAATNPEEDQKMSCGFSPEMAAMLAQMAKEKEKSANDATVEYLAQQEQAKKAQQRYESVQAKQATDSGYDWTRPYEKWEAWEDPEELAEKEQQAREKAEHAAMQQACNHDHSAERKLMDMSTAEKMLQCDHFRLLGNQFFAHAQYQRAAYHYHRALIYFEYMFSDTDEEQRKMDDLKKKILVNFALCRLKTRHLDQAIHNAGLALKIDSSNVKAMYIKAVAYRMQDLFDSAQKELDQAMLLSPDDASLAQELRILTIKKAAYRVKSKQLGAAMFQKASLPPSTSSTSLMRDVDLQKALDVNLRSLTAPTESIESWYPSTRGIDEMKELVVKLSGNNDEDAVVLI